MIRAILFDFNGVIVNDEPLQMKAYQQIFQTEGVGLSEADYLACSGMDDRSFIRHRFKLAEREISDERVNDFIEQKTALWQGFIEEETPLFEGVEDFVKKCERRYALGIASMARREEIEYILEKTGMRECFTHIVSSADVSNHKPDAECFHKAFQAIDKKRMSEGHYPLLRRECLVIEDVPQGIAGAKNAGMQVLAVTNTFDEKTLREAGADVVTKNLADWTPEAVALAFS